MTLQTTVRYGQMRIRGLFNVETDAPLKPGDLALIRSARGQELGTILATPIGTNDPETAGCGQGACGSCASSQGVVLRKADDRDRQEHEEQRRTGTRREIAFARERASQLGLKMRISDAEYLYQKEKLVLHFTADSRVNFRDLVRELAKQFNTRIELKQIGARDEARLVGDMASCGRELCCRTFLHDLQPVSMRMAKQQKKTLDPSKISGQCGKLKCCLRYEDEVYVEMQKTLPRKNAWVRIEKGVGKVLTTDLLLQKLVVSIAGQREVVHVTEILATAKSPEELQESRPGQSAPAGTRKKVTPLKLDPGLFPESKVDTGAVEAAKTEPTRGAEARQPEHEDRRPASQTPQREEKPRRQSQKRPRTEQSKQGGPPQGQERKRAGRGRQQGEQSGRGSPSRRGGGDGSARRSPSGKPRKPSRPPSSGGGSDNPSQGSDRLQRRRRRRRR